MSEAALILWGSIFVVALVTVVLVALTIPSRLGAKAQESMEQRVTRLENDFSRVRGDQDAMIQECLGLLRRLSKETDSG